MVNKYYQDNLVTGASIRDGKGKRIDTTYATKEEIPNLDNVSISKNSSDALQTIAVIDNNSNAIKTWTGTKVQYDAITTKDSNTLYHITDDEPLVISDFTTLVNQVASQLAKKVDLPDNKGQDGIDYVVEWKKPTSSDPTWYRVYKSGWVEQGGYKYCSSLASVTITLSKSFKDTDYIALCSSNSSITMTGNYECTPNIIKSSTNSILLYNGERDKYVSWEVKGQGA